MRDAVRKTFTLSVLLLLAANIGCRHAATPPPEPVFYPSPPDPPRIQFLRTYSTERDIAIRKFQWVDRLVGEPEGNQRGFQQPHGLAAAPDRLYVCDVAAGTVWVTDFAAGTLQPIAGDRGQGKLKRPVNIAMDADGHKYVTDILRRQIVVYGPDDQYVTAFGGEENFRPTGLAVVGDELIVSNIDESSHEIQVRNKRTGEVIRTFGSPQSAPPEEAVALPQSLAVDGHNNIMVCNTRGFRVSLHARDGTFLGSFGEIGRGPGQFAHPRGIAVDRENRIYVVDAAFENVQLFNEEHKLLMWFGGPSTRGFMALPRAVAIDYDNVDYLRQYVAPGYDLEYLIWVSNQVGSRKVNCYGFLRPAGTETTKK